MDPAVVALLNYEEDPEIIFYGLDLNQFDLIFIPINDNNDKFNLNGGNHWSLLVYLSKEDIFLYYDSIKKRTSNLENAKKIAQKLRVLINGKTYALKTLDNFIINSETPQQKNGYDCGVYVLAFTEILIQFLQQKQSIFDHKAMASIISEEYIDKFRVQIKTLVESLIKK